jgi:hypothetical protein
MRVDIYQHALPLWDSPRHLWFVEMTRLTYHVVLLPLFSPLKIHSLGSSPSFFGFWIPTPTPPPHRTDVMVMLGDGI